ncbi:Ubiquitin carboxyl-terminal hydrolase 51, partial [Actinomortierella ambigua]
MEMSMGSLYCHSCGDFVYDRDFDNIRKDEVLRSAESTSMVQESGTKRPRYVKWHASTKEAAAIRANTHLKPCVGLRGLRNMGSTCFMNVILQCFIHNPLLRGYFLSDMHSSKRCEVKSD